MKTIKDDKLSNLQNVYLFRKQYQFALTVLSGFTLDETPELLNDSDLWDNISAALGKKGVFDLAMPKPQGEVVVVGKCFAPGGKPVSHREVSFRVGNVQKRAIVFGNRTWEKSGGAFKKISKPEPFMEMDISWDNAFGGSKYKKNPDGKGSEDIQLPSGEEVRPLPNVEDPDNLIVSASDKPSPAGFGPLGLDWSIRLKKLGTFDKKWLKEDWPGYPDDYNFGYFNVASKDQRIKEFWTGGEKIEVANMHSEKPSIRSRVPEIRARSFVNTVTDDGESFEEIPLIIDTIWLLPNQNTGVAIWRGETVVSDDEASQVSHLLAFYEDKEEESKSEAFYHDKLNEAPEDAELKAFEAEGKVAKKMGLKVPGAVAATMAAAGAAAVVLDDEESDKAEKEPDSGEAQEEAGTKPADVEEPPEADAEGAAGDTDLSPEEQAEFVAAMKEQFKGTDLEDMIPQFEQMLAQEPKPDAQPFEPPKDAFNVESMDPGIWELENDEFEKAVAQHLNIPYPPPRKTPLGQEPKSIEEARSQHIENFLTFKKHLQDQDIDDSEMLAALDDLETELKQAKEQADKGTEKAPETEVEGQDAPAEEEQAPSAKESVQGKLDSGESLEGADLTGADLEGMDLQGCNLNGAVMENVNLSGVNLKGAVLSGAILTGAIFSGAKLKGAKLSEATVSGGNFAKADLSGADLSNADFHQADFSEADLTGATLKGADLSETNLNRAKCAGVQAEEIKLEGADLTEADFQNSNLKEADLTAATIDKANFEKADLGNAILYGIVGTTAIFKDADMNHSRSDDKTRITEAEFSGANLSEVAWNEADFRDTNFTGADFSKGSLLQCNFGNSNFQRVIARETNFSKCNFNQSNLTEVNLFKGNLRKADLTEADLSRSNLYSVDFYLAKIQDTLFEDANLNKTLLSKSKESEK